MVHQLITDVMELQVEEEEESLILVEVDPVLLMSDQQIKAEVEKLLPQRALFKDVKKFARDMDAETGVCEPVDTLMQTLVRTRYPGIPPKMLVTIIKPQGELGEGAKDLPVYHVKEGTSEKALVTAIFPSTDPTVLKYNLKGKAAEHTDKDYKSVGNVSGEEELDSTQISQIW